MCSSRCVYRVRPYEAEKGATNRMYEKWNEKLKGEIKSLSLARFNKNVKAIVADFDSIPTLDIEKPRVGIVGEILVKYHPAANNNVVELVEAEGAEAVVPDLMGFIYFICDHANSRHELLTVSGARYKLSNMAIKLIEFMQKSYKGAIEGSKFGSFMKISDMRKLVKGVVSTGNIAGEGWFLSAEMIELIHSGVNNIICMQPFACLPNHVTGKGIIGELRRQNPESNIIAVDYDPGASEVNQVNRIKLMLTQAFRQMREKKLPTEENIVAPEAKVKINDKYSALDV